MLCLAGGGASVKLAVVAFSLAWTHTVEKTEWQEDWRVTPAGLVLEEARIRGSGAGMEPPPEAVLKDGTWHYRPALPPLPQVSLRRAEGAGDWRLCEGGRCTPLASLLPAGADPVTMSACR